MKKLTAQFFLFLAAAQMALGQPMIPVNNISPVGANSLIGNIGASGRAESIPLGAGLSFVGGALVAGGASGSAPADATYITQTPNGTLTSEQALSFLSTGIMFVTTGTGAITSLTMSGDATFASNGALTLSSTAVTPGTYGSATAVPTIIVDSKGRITSASNTTITATGNVTAAGTLTSGDIVIGQGAKTLATSSVFSISGSNATVTGNLSVTGGMTLNNLTTSNLTVTTDILSTGVSDGQLYIGAAGTNAFSKANIIAGSNIIIANGANSISVSATTGGGGAAGSGLLSGGGVALAPGGGFDITVSAASYAILNTIYSSPMTDLTIAASDPTNPRIDVVAVNTSGAAVIITGTPSATPAKPDVDPTTQLELTFFLVQAASTDLDVDVVDVYLNNAEWTTTQSGGTINVASTNNPYTGAVCIEGSSVATGHYVRFEKPAAGTFDMADSDNLVFYIRSKASWATNRVMSITVRNGGVQVGTSVTFDQGVFGFNSANTTTYQQIIVPTALFSANGLTANQIQITVGGSGGTLGFYIDDVTLQGGVASVIDSSRMKWRGNYLASNFYNVNDVVLSSGIQYVSIQAGVGNTPVSSPTFWQASSANGGGTVTISGSPSSGQAAVWASGTAIGGSAYTGAGSPVASTSPTITTPTFTSNMTLATGASPTTSAVAVTAFDTDAWAASRGAVQVHDGTANTFLVGALASDIPSNGQVPTWNTGGTVTWETPAAGTPTSVAMTATLGSDDTYTGVTLAGLNAGATIAQWEVVYVGGSSTYLLADANGSGTYPARGLAVAGYSSTDPAVILREGPVRNDAWAWTPGGTIYLSATPGGLTQTAPSTSGDKVQQVGFALTADIAYFNFASGEYVTVQ